MELAVILGVVLGVVVGAVIGGIAIQLRAGRNRARLETDAALVGQRLESVERDNAELKQRAEKAESSATASGQEVATLRAELRAEKNQLQNQLDIKRQMSDQFRAISAEVLSSNSNAFLKGANEKVDALVRPLSDELKRIETERAKIQGSLSQQIDSLVQNNRALEQETRSLSTALRKPEVRGYWGEIHLRRVVELAGMVKYCDFFEQVTVYSPEGKTERPDMIVKMPNERVIVVDAKTPMNAYLRATESETEKGREQALSEHAKSVRSRVNDLAKKSYWASLDNSPEFVVMYLPGEFVLQPALEKDHELIDYAMERGVVIATPTTLITLLKTVELGWREVRLAEEAQSVAELGKKLHDGIAGWASHLLNMRKSLAQTVASYNSGINTLHSQVLGPAREFKLLGVSSKRDIPEPKTIGQSPTHYDVPTPRTLNATRTSERTEQDTGATTSQLDTAETIEYAVIDKDLRLYDPRLPYSPAASPDGQETLEDSDPATQRPHGVN